MWTPLSASRWVLLLTLGVVMLLSESEADEHGCCYNPQMIKITPDLIVRCVRQTSHKCKQDAYVLDLTEGRLCVNPKVKWLQDLIQQGEIECPDRYRPAPILEDLDEDKEEEEEEEEEE